MKCVRRVCFGACGENLWKVQPDIMNDTTKVNKQEIVWGNCVLWFLGCNKILSLKKVLELWLG